MKSSSATNIPLKKLYPDGRYPGPFVNDEPTKMPKNPPLPPRRPKQEEDTSSSDETLEDMKAKSDAMKMKKGGSVKGAKVGKVMGEFKAGKLHSGGKKGPTVTSKKQAIAIAMSEARKASGMKKGGKVAVSSRSAVKSKRGK